ncbi:Variant surface glycoprotein [Trypanosoma congolense IL3000]|uniref:Variant surface glycoprotein n=1 Tax=Trypanosoma congolense (strain IL3000) TaxID=1068625 RepID=F9WFL2_TRYCI|nr:Variant surface glycoprotein [Trypanosoma congolense IL3000]
MPLRCETELNRGVMTLFKSRISFATLLLPTWLSTASGQLKEGYNAKQYGILCDIYNVAANPPTSLYDAGQVEKIRNEIDVINASLGDDSWFSHISETGSNVSLTGEYKDQNNNGASNWNRLKNAVAKVHTNSTTFKKIPSTSPSVKLAQKKLKNIIEQVEKITREIRTANTASSLDGIKKDFDEVIGRIGEETTTFDRAAECGPGGFGAAGSNAGKFLIVDFLCLCAKPTWSWTLPNVCGPDLRDNRWDKTGEDGKGTCKPDERGRETWKILKEGCENRGRPETADPAAGYTALGEFLSAISQDTATTDKNKPGIFGSVYNGRGVVDCQDGKSGCTGRNCPNNGACVYYGENRKDGGKDIPWVQKFKSGLEKLEKIQSKSFSIQRLIGHLEMLQMRAGEIYEEATTSINLQRENLEEPAAHNTTRSHSQHGRLILPWTLLI